MAESIGLRTNDPRFWDKADLRAEVDRIFDVCHSCRLCFKFCGSFPAMFEMIDAITEQRRSAHLAAHPEVTAEAERKRAAAAAAGPRPHDEGERAEAFGDELPELAARACDLTGAQIDRVVDLCFQCKLCYPNCPYTPPHEFALDFPRLLLRWKAHRVRAQGVPLRTRIVRNAPLLGAAGSLAPALARWGLANPLARAAMEKLLNIHRERELPAFHGQTFARWWARHVPRVEAPQPPREGVTAPMPLKVVLFATCAVNYNEPVTGTAAVEVLEHNGVEVAYQPAQMCCGMPILDGGDLEALSAYARQNVELLASWVDRGYEVVIPSPSCSLVIREEYPQVLDDPAAARVAGHSHDLCDYLFRIAREGRLKRDFARRLPAVKYHVPCHLRVQNIGFRARDLLKMVADEVTVVQECSGHDGTWSMQKEHFADSLHWGRKLFDAVRPAPEAGCTATCSDCALAAVQIHQGAGVRSLHPVVVLAYAYGFEVGDAARALAAGA